MKGAASAALLHAAIEINPVPAARPKVGRWNTYYPKTYAKWRKDAVPYVPGDTTPIEGPVVAVFEIVVEKARTSKRLWPVGDWDNFGKAPSDLFNDAVWKDDDQIVGAAVFKRFAEPGETPGTYVTWVPINLEE